MAESKAEAIGIEPRPPERLPPEFKAEPMRVADIKPGMRVPYSGYRTVVEVRCTMKHCVLIFDDGTEQMYELDKDPALMVEKG